MAPAKNYNDYVLRVLSDQESSPEESFCPICYDEWHEEDLGIVKTHCNHVFHKSCILTWINGHKSCPYCRAELWQTLKEFAKALERSIYRTHQLHLDFLDEDSIKRLTLVRLSDTSREDRFAWAANGLYRHFVPQLPTGTTPFVNIVYKSQVIEGILFTYRDKMKVLEWLSLIHELDECRKEVAALGSAPENFPAGMQWTGTEVWDQMIRLPNAFFEVRAKSLRKGPNLTAAYNTIEELRRTERRRPILEPATRQSLLSELASISEDVNSTLEDVIPVTESDTPHDFDRKARARERYLRWDSDSDSDAEPVSDSDDEEENQGFLIKPLLEHIEITAEYNRTRNETRVRIAVNHPGAIEDIVAGARNRMAIFTRDGHVLELGF
ncbi:hypothetical protein P171DRAFT_482010 [Karstenula rhodostoma CBS 690.94]|uniref:RING-type domain-containing protein n=1 Tax=Karstenula rhodostoma CBS 690.94 TaxID=1392251 RepID=A0A9P4UFW8_9PLEO|nr:hypothetical protein P171DRAFT_482010 [Karstenula rhodostoma CBS 690.94]